MVVININYTFLLMEEIRYSKFILRCIIFILIGYYFHITIIIFKNILFILTKNLTILTVTLLLIFGKKIRLFIYIY